MVPVILVTWIDVSRSRFHGTHPQFTLTNPAIGPQIVSPILSNPLPFHEVIQLTPLILAIMSECNTGTGDVFAGKLFRWYPDSEQRTEPLVVDSGDEIFIGRDRHAW